MASYQYFPEDCGVENCLIDGFDKNLLPGPPYDCQDNPSCAIPCLECARNAEPCNCTCLDYQFTLTAQVNYVAPGVDPGDFHYCQCYVDGLPVNSLDGTLVITGWYLSWEEDPTFPDRTFGGISARTCPDFPDWTAQVWSPKMPNFIENLVCTKIPTDALWDPVIDLGTNPVSTGSTDTTFFFPFGPEPILGTPRYDCGAIRIPPAAFVLVRNGCNVVMAACPIPFPAQDTVPCPDPTPPDCCTPYLLEGFSTGCVDGEATIHVSVGVTCPDRCKPCGGSLGTVTWSAGGSGAELTPTFDSDGASYTFTVPCEEGDKVDITITFECSPDCSECGLVSNQYCIPVDGGDFTSGPCL